MNNDLFIRCECGTEGLNIIQDDETGDVYFAMWYYGQHDMGIRHKIRWIWQIIIGKPFLDEIAMDVGWIPLLIDHLKAMKVEADRL